VIAAGTLGELVRDTVGGGRVVTVKLDRAPDAAIEGLAGEGDGTVWRGPVRDVAEVTAHLSRRGCALVGPNGPGLITPRRCSARERGTGRATMPRAPHGG
jgi:succinyl-CoA synthetase alpha subunit